MESSSQISKQDCSAVLLQEYLDGELSPELEIVLEQHLAGCNPCLNELNLQKSVLGILDHGFEPALPKDFAEVVATKAESQVVGLRRSNERFSALTVAAFLILTVIVLLAFDVSQPVASLGTLIGNLAAFIALIGSVLANITIGIYVIAKAFAQQADPQTAILVFAVAIIIASIIVWVIRTGRISQLKEIKR